MLTSDRLPGTPVVFRSGNEGPPVRWADGLSKCADALVQRRDEHVHAGGAFQQPVDLFNGALKDEARRQDAGSDLGSSLGNALVYDGRHERKPRQIVFDVPPLADRVPLRQVIYQVELQAVELMVVKRLKCLGETETLGDE